MTQLEIWEQVGYQIWEDEAREMLIYLFNDYRERGVADPKAKGRIAMNL
jgi:hypothetical protein